MTDEIYSQEEMRAYLYEGKPLPVRGEAQKKTRPRTSHTRGVMNKTEKRYADLLELRKIGGEIKDYWFERVTLKLADDLRYTPDFMVEFADGRIEFHEVKGAYVWEDAKVKFKMAAQEFPCMKFVFAQYEKGKWEITTARVLA